MLVFPALSYVTAILIISETMLGDTVHGCWNAIYATLQGAVPATLILWLLGNARLWVSTSMFAATLSTFIITLPESTQVTAKRIALAQIVILYSVTTSNGVSTEPLLHPAHLVVSSMVAAFTSVLALLIPVPHLDKLNEVGSFKRNEDGTTVVQAACRICNDSFICVGGICDVASVPQHKNYHMPVLLGAINWLDSRAHAIGLMSICSLRTADTSPVAGGW